jgi:hypothetical protein
MKVEEVNDKLQQPASTGATELRFTKDFGFLPIPRHLQYDPSKPPRFGLALNIGFGFASTFSE